MHVNLRTSVLAIFIGSAACQLEGITSSTCEQECQAFSNATITWEREQHASADFEFYQVPSNFSADLAEGKVLQIEYATNISDYTVPGGLTMSRIIYTTANTNGTILPASAYILWPYGALDSAGLQDGEFPVVGWTHGTSGFFKGCAPSNYRSLQYHFMAPYLLALQGMAVVAPDYAGLGFDALPDGAPTQHNWLNAPSQATDMANAIIAAREAFPAQLPSEGPFVSMGHSQGGAAAWAFAERMSDKPLEGYKGTVAIAPPTRTFELLEEVLALPDPSMHESPGVVQLQPALVAAVTAAFPAYNYSGMTELSYDRWKNVYEPLSGCLPNMQGVFGDVPIPEATNPEWFKDPTVQEYAELSSNGRRKFKGPMLVLAGEMDQVVGITSVQSAVNDTCAMLEGEGWGESLEMVEFEGVNHFPVIQASSMRWLGWVKERLSAGEKDEKVKSGCVKNVEKGYRTELTSQTISPNFLVEWASPMEGAWKYSL